jgi:ubiquitin carboxyl-terminal hydrolase 48
LIFFSRRRSKIFPPSGPRRSTFLPFHPPFQNRPGSIIYQLQLLFASLQDGMRSYYDPTPFTNQLDLQTDVQQDVQEFNKALITFLEEKFGQYPQPGIQNLVQEQFRGDCEYVTLCKNCGRVSTRPSQFYELELHLEQAKRLEDCIRGFTGVEMLTGDNAYKCEQCNKAVDAKRCIRLKKLPEVLNFQLMRFHYDIKTGRKKKIQKQIAFPAKLDMRTFLQHPLAADLMTKKGSDFVDDFDMTGEYDYELSSVLIHKGSSAYGGHYTALIRDEMCVFVARYFGAPCCRL